MALKEKWYKSVVWIHPAHDTGQWRALVNTVLKLRVPKNAENFMKSSATISLSRRTILYGVTLNSVTKKELLQPFTLNSINVTRHYN